MNLEAVAESAGLREAFCFEVHCHYHGDLRIISAEQPGKRHGCPFCGASCSCFPLPAVILTARDLPIVVQIQAAGYLDEGVRGWRGVRTHAR
jgi:hypothetical protein